MRYRTQRRGIAIVGICLLTAVVFLIFLISSIVSQGVSGLNLQFLTSFPSYKPDIAGIFPVLTGSIYLMLLTMLFSAPLGVGAAIFLNEIIKFCQKNIYLYRPALEYLDKKYHLHIFDNYEQVVS